MVFTRKLLALPLLLVPVLVFAFPAESPAQQQKQKQPLDKPKQPPAPKPGAVRDFEEAELLKQACLLMLGANHDYEGHRGKAMHAVKEAFKILDQHVQKDGTPQQKAAIKKEHTAIADAEKAVKNVKMVHERQPASDAQLSQARAELNELRPTLVKSKQQKSPRPRG
jgi:hypothetical protein